SMLILSFLAPFMLAVSTSEHFAFWLLYAPVWIVGIQEGTLYAGPTPMPLLLFLFWIPYVYVGYEFKRLTEGRLESWFDFALRVLIATAIVVVFSIQASFVQTGGGVEGPMDTRYIPLPVLPVLALIMGWKFKPDRGEGPWREEESETGANETNSL
ncbi:MAG: hypothetical protein KGY80_14480, partial [Candidatus Thorarchaeota archaeon]|nr:hypothetical protein [Candidatus Thorarchaeota archaeon]